MKVEQSFENCVVCKFVKSFRNILHGKTLQKSLYVFIACVKQIDALWKEAAHKLTDPISCFGQKLGQENYNHFQKCTALNTPLPLMDKIPRVSQKFNH